MLITCDDSDQAWTYPLGYVDVSHAGPLMRLAPPIRLAAIWQVRVPVSLAHSIAYRAHCRLVSWGIRDCVGASAAFLSHDGHVGADAHLDPGTHCAGRCPLPLRWLAQLQERAVPPGA